MGQVLAFPRWRVISRDEHNAPGEPRLLIDPHGRYLQIEATLRRRLIAAPDPQLPMRYESLVRAGGEIYLLVFTEGEDEWIVQPA